MSTIYPIYLRWYLKHGTSNQLHQYGVSTAKFAILHSTIPHYMSNHIIASCTTTKSKMPSVARQDPDPFSNRNKNPLCVDISNPVNAQEQETPRQDSQSKTRIKNRFVSKCLLVEWSAMRARLKSIRRRK